MQLLRNAGASEAQAPYSLRGHIDDVSAGVPCQIANQRIIRTMKAFKSSRYIAQLIVVCKLTDIMQQKTVLIEY